MPRRTWNAARVAALVLLLCIVPFAAAASSPPLSDPAQTKDFPSASAYCENAARPLAVRDYTGDNQPMHPKVLYFDKPWNKFRYWMSYTPYPYGSSMYENPSIAVSNDGEHWTVPFLARNPLVRKPLLGAHYSDPQLVMAGNTMQLWYRYNPPLAGQKITGKYKHYVADDSVSLIQFISTADGVHWSAPHKVFSDGNDYLSADILCENGRYQVWFTNYDGRMYYRQSADLKKWTPAREVNLDLPGYAIWHQDMIRSARGYETVFCAYKKGSSMDGMSLYYAESPDGVNFDHPVMILAPSSNPLALDNRMIYRSSIVYVGTERKIFYSAVSRANEWHIFETDLIAQPVYLNNN